MGVNSYTNRFLCKNARSTSDIQPVLHQNLIINMDSLCGGETVWHQNSCSLFCPLSLISDLKSITENRDMVKNHF